MLYDIELFQKNLQVKETGWDYARGWTEHLTLFSTSKDREERKDDSWKTYLRNWKAGEETDHHPTHKNYEP